MENENKGIAIIEKPVNIAKLITLIKGTRKSIHSEEQAAQQFEIEKFDFKRQLFEKGIGDDCTAVSVAGVFHDVVRNGLSFASSMSHVYVMTRSVKNAVGQYEKRLYYTLTPDGIIFMAQKARSVLEVENPVLVYEGDEFAPYRNSTGDQVVTHKPLIPRKKDAKIIAGYVFMTLPSGRKEAYYMLEEDWKRLQGFSAKQNRNETGNALYTSGPFGQIDSGFLKAKLIKFALKNKRKAIIQGDTYTEDEDETSYVEVHNDEPKLDMTPAENIPPARIEDGVPYDEGEETAHAIYEDDINPDEPF